MTKFAIIAALAASVAAPAFAETPLQFAVENHNMSVERFSDRIETGTQTSPAAQALAIAIHNSSLDMGSEQINGSVGTSSGPTGRAAAIFDRLAAESREDG